MARTGSSVYNSRALVYPRLRIYRGISDLRSEDRWKEQEKDHALSGLSEGEGGERGLWQRWE